jgi:hypothetical protein
VVTWTVAILASYGGAALVATAQAVIFRRLTQWREGVRPCPGPRVACGPDHSRSRNRPTSGTSAGGIG